MPKRKEPPLSPQEQSERFRKEAQRLIDAGELNPTEADAALDALVKSSRNAPSR
jgi:polyhydroxyalkanoate synthesis regulator phasin